MEESKHFGYSGGFLYDTDSRRVLLQLRDDKAPVNPNKWGLFGGGREENETPKECFIREMEEELALALKEEEVIPLWDYFNPKRNTQRYIFYVNKFIPKVQMTLNEGADFDWISLDELSKYDLTDFARKDLITFKDMITIQS